MRFKNTSKTTLQNLKGFRGNPQFSFGGITIKEMKQENIQINKDIKEIGMLETSKKWNFENIRDLETTINE